MNGGFKTSVEEVAAAMVEITKELGKKAACDGNCSGGDSVAAVGMTPEVQNAMPVWLRM